MNFDELAYGTREHRRAPRHDDEVAELGREAIKGVVTVGTVGIAAQFMGGVLGGFGK